MRFCPHFHVAPAYYSSITTTQWNAHPVQSARKAAAASSVLGTPPFCRYPRFLASRLKNSSEFRKSGTLYWSMIWNMKSRCPEKISKTLRCGRPARPSPLVMAAFLTCILSHCLSRALTASRTLSWPSSTCRLLRAIDAAGLDARVTTPGLSSSFTLFEMCTSCMNLTRRQELLRRGFKMHKQFLTKTVPTLWCLSWHQPCTQASPSCCWWRCSFPR